MWGSRLRVTRSSTYTRTLILHSLCHFQSCVFFGPARAASEMTEIKNAVSGLKSALDAVRTNIDPASTNILRLNLREARDQLSRRVAEVSPATEADPSIAAATREARILLVRWRQRSGREGAGAKGRQRRQKGCLTGGGAPFMAGRKAGAAWDSGKLRNGSD